MKIDWRSKLTSRKFWVAVVGFVSAILFAFNVDAGSTEKIIGIITAGAVMIAYIIGEGLVDSNRNE